MLSLCDRFVGVRGEVEFVFLSGGVEVGRVREGNLVKIQAKEVLAHRLASGRVWDGSGWVSSGVLCDELAVRYFVFGASFDGDGNALDVSDERFYSLDSVSGGYVPVRLGVGCEFGGGLVNAVPISEPGRPLKRVERVYFEPSYQPAGSPLLQGDVRALNNVVVFETTLRRDEYNGFGSSSSDFFSICEVALVGGDELGVVGACECDPHDLFLVGNGVGAIGATASGSSTVSILPSEVDSVDVIGVGDTVKLVEVGSTVGGDGVLGQVSPFYLVVGKSVGGFDVVLDRVPVDADGVSLSGSVGLFRDRFRVFSHRILSSPVKKSVDFEIVVRWRIVLG